MSVVVEPEDRGGGDGTLAVVLTFREIYGDVHVRRSFQGAGVKPMGSVIGPVLPESGNQVAPGSW